MQGTALIVQIENAVVVPGVRTCDGAIDVNVRVTGDRYRFKHIECVVVYQRYDARDLGDHEEDQEAGAKPADCSNERHARL